MGIAITAETVKAIKSAMIVLESGITCGGSGASGSEEDIFEFL